MSEKRDYYEVPGVDKSATPEEIKRLIERKPFSITRIRILGIK